MREAALPWADEVVEGGVAVGSEEAGSNVVGSIAGAVAGGGTGVIVGVKTGGVWLCANALAERGAMHAPAHKQRTSVWRASVVGDVVQMRWLMCWYFLYCDLKRNVADCCGRDEERDEG